MTLVKNQALRSAVVVVVIVFVMCAAGNVSDRRASDDPDGVAADVVQQSLQWMDTAAQDTDPLTRWQHLALAKAYLNVARHVASDMSIERASRTHVRALSKRIEQEMQTTVVSIHKMCHKLKPQLQLPKTTTMPGEKNSKRVTWY